MVSLGRLVASRYANGLFPRIYTTEDGRVYNVSWSSLDGQVQGHTAEVDTERQPSQGLISAGGFLLTVYRVVKVTAQELDPLESVRKAPNQR